MLLLLLRLLLLLHLHLLHLLHLLLLPPLLHHLLLLLHHLLLLNLLLQLLLLLDLALLLLLLLHLHLHLLLRALVEPLWWTLLSTPRGLKVVKLPSLRLVTLFGPLEPIEEGVLAGHTGRPGHATWTPPSATAAGALRRACSLACPCPSTEYPALDAASAGVMAIGRICVAILRRRTRPWTKDAAWDRRRVAATHATVLTVATIPWRSRRCEPMRLRARRAAPRHAEALQIVDSTGSRCSRTCRSSRTARTWHGLPTKTHSVRFLVPWLL